MATKIIFLDCIQLNNGPLQIIDCHADLREFPFVKVWSRVPDIYTSDNPIVKILLTDLNGILFLDTNLVSPDNIFYGFFEKILFWSTQG